MKEASVEEPIAAPVKAENAGEKGEEAAVPQNEEEQEKEEEDTTPKRAAGRGKKAKATRGRGRGRAARGRGRKVRPPPVHCTAGVRCHLSSILCLRRACKLVSGFHIHGLLRFLQHARLPEPISLSELLEQ